jgi:hypothetical protein
MGQNEDKRRSRRIGTDYDYEWKKHHTKCKLGLGCIWLAKEHKKMGRSSVTFK